MSQVKLVTNTIKSYHKQQLDVNFMNKEMTYKNFNLQFDKIQTKYRTGRCKALNNVEIFSVIKFRIAPKKYKVDNVQLI